METENDLIEKVLHTIQKYSMLSHGDRLLAGLSGGPDSVCLLTVLERLKPEFDLHLSAVYVDHGLRPEETPHEIEFCKDLCGSFDISFSIKHVDVKSVVKKGVNKQEAARELRYNAFNETAYEVNANRIALGHNADDHAETILMRLFRGTGPYGLSGIPPVRKNIIRPLIEIERTEIERFLENEGIAFIIDSSNLGEEYSRNKIRHSIMPVIKKMNRDFVKTISRTSEIFREEERYFEILVTKILMKMITRKTDKSIELFLAPMVAMDTVLLRRVLRRAIDETKGLRGISLIHIEDIMELIKSGKSGDRVYLPGDMRAIKSYATLFITSEKPHRLDTYTLESPGETVLKESSMVLVSKIINIDDIADYGNGKTAAALDADKLSFPLTIRARMPGDYFYPAGFGKRKKVQDYFVDGKIPRDERDSTPLLINNNEIVWVIGHRVDERYKIDKNTKRVLKFEIKPLKI
jgi:tRNA(Ile)-lysidine synthase